MRYLGAPTMQRLAAWLSGASIAAGGPLFRQVLKDGATVSGRLGVRSIRSIIVRRAAAAGVAGRVSGHSLRVGSAQSLAAAGAGLVELQEAGDWQAPTMPAHYARHQLAARGAVAKVTCNGRSGGAGQVRRRRIRVVQLPLYVPVGGHAGLSPTRARTSASVVRTSARALCATGAGTRSRAAASVSFTHGARSYGSSRVVASAFMAQCQTTGGRVSPWRY